MPALPILVRDNVPRPLRRLTLAPPSVANPDGYDEKWLQDLIQACPEVLPVSEIEPGFGQLIPIATEVACGHGYIDNLFVTAQGGVVIVETKLWRNLEARRLVVAQLLDYAAALSGMNYETFERAALAGGLGRAKPRSLHTLVAERADALDEPDFIPAVSQNLKRGRMLVIAAGDGVRAEAEALADLLQSHAGARFTFALVAIELFKADNGAVLAVPRNVAKTQLIERGVVDIRDERVSITPSERPLSSGSAPRTSLTEEDFLDAMAKRNERLPIAIRDFLARLVEVGVEPEWLASLKLRWSGGPDGSVNLGYINRSGSIATDMTSYKLGERADSYLQALARMSGGRIIKSDQTSWPRVTGPDGRNTLKIEHLLPAHTEGWVRAIRQLTSELQAIPEN